MTTRHSPARRFPWRIVFLLGTAALVVISGWIIRDGLDSGKLRSAVRSNDVATVTRLLDRRPELVTIEVLPQGGPSSSRHIRWQGRTLLHETISITGGSIAMAETLLEHGADLSVRLSGNTLLHLAASAGDLPSMAWLLERGAEVDAANGCEHPARAVCTSGEFANLQPFDRGQRFAERCPGCAEQGQTPLHAAQRAMTEEATVLLLAHGANVHAADAAGRTPLHYAAEAATGDAARVLCAWGADPSRRDADGKTPQDLARAADLAHPGERFSQSGPGEVAGWLQPGGACATVATRARPGAPVPMEEVNAAWRAYACTRDPQWCG